MFISSYYGIKEIDDLNQTMADHTEIDEATAKLIASRAQEIDPVCWRFQSAPRIAWQKDLESRREKSLAQARQEILGNELISILTNALVRTREINDILMSNQAQLPTWTKKLLTTTDSVTRTALLAADVPYSRETRNPNE